MDCSVAQAVEHLLCKCEILSSNSKLTPSPKYHDQSFEQFEE
jgi:hypothetical protein